jgi:pyruvate ferredoxin oxidoreductase alpha subunit
MGITSFRPFPLDAVRNALQHARRVIVLEKSLAVGIGGIVATNVRMALDGAPVRIRTVVAGLGGRPITRASLHRVFHQGQHDQLEPVHFLDLDWNVVNRQLERERKQRRSGPIAESILRDVGHPGPRIG